MAKNNALLKLLRCKFIIDEIEKGYHPSLSDLTTNTNRFLEDINSIVGDINTISERTVKRDISEIRELFGITINSRNGYSIDESCSDTESTHATLDSLLLFFIQNNTPNANSYIRSAPRKASGSEHFFTILKAITDKKKVSFSYSQYEKKEVTHRLVSPLGLKEFKGFWYLVAADKKNIKTFGLDRIDGLSISLENAFVPEGFDMDEYYKYCFGIVRFLDSKPQDIIIKTTPIKAAYYKANPLHHSQRIIKETNDSTTFSLFMYLTYDLQQELRSHGAEQVEVLKPDVTLGEVRYF